MVVLLDSGWEDSGGADLTDGGKWNAGSFFSGAGVGSVVASPVHRGNYAFNHFCPIGTYGGTIYQVPSPSSTLSVRNYCRVDIIQDYDGFGCGIQGTIDTIANSLNITSSAEKWTLFCWANSGWQTYLSSARTINPNQWYCIELDAFIDAIAGFFKVYIDGTLEINQTGLDTTGHGDCNRYWCGAGPWSNPASDFNATFDDAIVQDSGYIGPLTTGAPALGTFLF